ncbi:MAG: hypothetical protein H0U65_04905 [Rubrobacter sp.]|nr:hypothetical protein [Rubrobacter sp.]
MPGGRESGGRVASLASGVGKARRRESEARANRIELAWELRHPAHEGARRWRVYAKEAVPPAWRGGVCRRMPFGKLGITSSPSDGMAKVLRNPGSFAEP